MFQVSQSTHTFRKENNRVLQDDVEESFRNGNQGWFRKEDRVHGRKIEIPLKFHSNFPLQSSKYPGGSLGSSGSLRYNIRSRSPRSPRSLKSMRSAVNANGNRYPPPALTHGESVYPTTILNAKNNQIGIPQQDLILYNLLHSLNPEQQQQVQ